jgi:hypothetical protein
MPSDPRDYRVEVSGVAPQEGSSKTRQTNQQPFLSIHFACCGVYCRIYRNREGTAYVGRCPKCAKPVRFLVADGGTDERFFIVE